MKNKFTEALLFTALLFGSVIAFAQQTPATQTKKIQIIVIRMHLHPISIPKMELQLVRRVDNQVKNIGKIEPITN